MALALVAVLAGCSGKNKLEDTVWEASATLKDGTPVVYIDVYDPDHVYQYQTANGEVILFLIGTYAITGDTVSVTWSDGAAWVRKLTGGVLVTEGSGLTFRQQKGQAARDSRKYVRDRVAGAVAEKPAAEPEKKTETAQPAKADTPKLAAESDFTVGLTSDGQGAYITGYVGNGGPLIIPATIQGMPVHHIVRLLPEGFIETDWTAKTRYKYMKPDGKGGATVNKYLIAKNGWVNLGEEPNPYYRPEYRGITSIVIPDGTEWTAGAFRGCSSLRSVTLPYGKKVIGNRDFAGCSSLTSITIPDSVWAIDYNAFEGCSSLTSITIPDSVTAISANVFEGCSSLTTVTISPVQGRKWGWSDWEHAFSDCPKLDLKSQAAIRAAMAAGVKVKNKSLIY